MPPQTPLRIAFVCEYEPDDIGAAGMNAHAVLIRSLRARGTDVVGINCDLTGAARAVTLARLFSANRAQWTGRYHLHPVAFRARTRNARQALEHATRQAPLDAIIQFGSAFDATLPGVPHLMWSDTISAVTAPEPYSWMNSLSRPEQARVEAQERVLISACDIVMPWSRYAGGRIAACVDLPEDRIRPTYVGPSMTLESSADARLARAGTDSACRVLFIGREFTRKGGDVLIEAVRRVRARGIDMRAVVVGPTSLDDVPPFVDFVGFLDKSVAADVQRLRDVYAQADIFCLPTRREPFGIAVAEAMLAGLPVIATRVSAIPEMVEEGVTGHLIAVDDVETLTERLAALAIDGQARDRMGRAGAAAAASNFVWDRVADRVEQAVRDAIARRRTSAR